MDERKCIHVPCKCTVEAGEEYCSGECQRADLEAGALNRTEFRCNCHHPDCEGVPETVASASEVMADPSEALAAG